METTRVDMKTDINIEITNEFEAKAFLSKLHANGEAFHPEDDAFFIINRDGSRFFTDEEAARLNYLMDQIYAIEDFDPCEYLLTL